MLSILADSLLIALRMSHGGTADRGHSTRSPEPMQRRKPADQRG